jgi:membrane protease YdiL (CAAX protease family)
MIHFLKKEFACFGQFLKSNGNEIIIVIFGTLFIVLNEYNPISSEWVSVFLYYTVFPILVILIILRKNPLDFGLRWGSPRLWWPWVLIIWVIAAVVLYAASFNTSLKDYYLEENFKMLTYFLTSCVNLGAQEFMYRGFLLFGLKDKFKEGSILLQTIPFVLVHLGKPELETVSTVFTGILFGYIAYRGKSFWPAFIIHLFINVFFVGIINWRYG